MKLFDLVSYLRLNILDDHGGVGVEWDSYDESEYGTLQLRWSNETLVSNINEALTQVYRRVNPAQELYELDVDVGASSYEIPPEISKVILVKNSIGEELKEKALEDIWGKADTGGNTKYYISDYLNNTILFFPSPKRDETLLIKAYRLPKTKLVWDDNQKDIDLREEYQIPMLDYAAYLCYTKDEANILDPRRAETFYNKFEREFPFTSAYSNIRKNRTSNRPIRYGGL